MLRRVVIFGFQTSSVLQASCRCYASIGKSGPAKSGYPCEATCDWTKLDHPIRPTCSRTQRARRRVFSNSEFALSIVLGRMLNMPVVQGQEVAHAPSKRLLSPRAVDERQDVLFSLHISNLNAKWRPNLRPTRRLALVSEPLSSKRARPTAMILSLRSTECRPGSPGDSSCLISFRHGTRVSSNSGPCYTWQRSFRARSW